MTTIEVVFWTIFGAFLGLILSVSFSLLMKWLKYDWRSWEYWVMVGITIGVVSVIFWAF